MIQQSIIKLLGAIQKNALEALNPLPPLFFNFFENKGVVIVFILVYMLILG